MILGLLIAGLALWLGGRVLAASSAPVSQAAMDNPNEGTVEVAAGYGEVVYHT